ncbi:Rhs family protein [Providencia stuartii]|nr:Rhs family protein [Providencia stuartii]MBS7785277.1 RHS domain-containing protein [Providencia thailandensis]MBN5559163.1 RHS domain-containing protein [Providencia stuartii]MTC83534.1 Rhs family protein [Providencia stuartii]MTC93691.1 Rhs family protein [Providencia stuartii]
MYHYDALGRRIHKVVESRAHGKPMRQETHFVWQGLRLLQEQDINTGKYQTYCYEEHGSYTPLAVIVKQPSGYHYYWHHCDINSAPLDVTNEQGNTVWSGKYERFGFVRSSPLSFYSDPERKMESFEQNLRYAGQYFDNETGLHFNTFRFYDPQIGRFIMPDPIGLLGGVNLYQYAPNPLGWIDPWGLAGNPATATHITYQGIDKATGKPYVGYASMQGNQTAQNVLKYRYGNDFSRFGGTPPVILYDGYGQKGKDIARGLEQRRFEQLGGLEGTANKQNPVGQGNARRTEYLNAADEHLNSKQTGTKKGGKC